MLRRPSLRSQLNQIRLWVRQGRTDAWIAHKLDVPLDQLNQFKREHGLDGEPAPGPPELQREPEPQREPERPREPEPPGEPEPPLEPERAGSELGDLGIHEPEEPEPLEREPAEAEPDAEPEIPDLPFERVPAEPEDSGPGPERPRRRRGRRGGRKRGGRSGASYQATFDHGDEGYGLWLDPAIADSDVYAEHWAGHRAVNVRIEPDAITIRREEEE